jgi:argininosuccinate lyase
VAVERGQPLSSFSDAELAGLAPGVDAAAVRALLERGSWLESKISAGGTAQARVREQLELARAALADG